MSTVKSPGIHASSLSHQTASLSRDTVALRDHKDEKSNELASHYIIVVQCSVLKMYNIFMGCKLSNTGSFFLSICQRSTYLMR